MADKDIRQENIDEILDEALEGFDRIDAELENEYDEEGEIETLECEVDEVEDLELPSNLDRRGKTRFYQEDGADSQTN
jgi:hypothetical protein